MPKLRLRNDQIQDACLRKAIDGSAGYFRLSANEQAEIAGVKRATWYRRLQTPEDFSLKEIRRMIASYNWDSKTVCAFLGVKEGLQ